MKPRRCAPGDVLTARDLLEALLLPSGADAAYTLAGAYGPGLAAFVARMNAAAARMGMRHTHFTSPDGLPYPTETSTYSTAGIKTGYTDDAGHCLLFEAIRNGRALIGVVLDSPATGPAAGAQDAARMLNWGF
ncbi:MAG: D-alanyl-D-alanine carboxypeptidase family protein, partial [Streptosporangiaceae bacterium]